VRVEEDWGSLILGSRRADRKPRRGFWLGAYGGCGHAAESSNNDAGLRSRTFYGPQRTVPAWRFQRTPRSSSSKSAPARLRARFGYLITPNDLIFGTVGPAWQHVEATVTCGSRDLWCESNPPVLRQQLQDGGRCDCRCWSGGWTYAKSDRPGRMPLLDIYWPRFGGAFSLTSSLAATLSRSTRV
jgi:hypothetical protein